MGYPALTSPLRFYKTMPKSRSLRVVLAVAALFWLICCGLALHRYFNFFPSYVSFDQGIFNQLFWNSLHGRLFESSLSSTESIAVAQGQVPRVDYHRLGQHFTPALMLWLPFYALFPSAAGLSVLQVTLVTAGGLVLYALARHYHPSHVSAWITVSYFAAGAVMGPTLANFHDICQIPLFVFGLLLAMEKRRWWVFWLLAVLTLLVREDAGVVLFGVGFYLLASRRFLWIGAAVCGLSFGYMLLLTSMVMPLFSDDVSKRFMVEQFGQFIDGQEASTLEVIGAIARQPGRLLVELVTPIDRTLKYLLAQWLPLAFVPAFSPSAWAIAGFPMLKNFLRQDRTALSVDLRYAMTLIPGLFYGAILWWKQHPNLFQPRTKVFWRFCWAIALIVTLTANPNRAISFAIPDSFRPWVYVAPPQQWQHSHAVRSVLSQIPADASVSASTHLVAHLSSRREAVRFPGTQVQNDAGQVISVDYLITDLWYPRQFQVAFKDDRAQLKEQMGAIASLLEQKTYGMVNFSDGVVLMQRGQPSNPAALEQWETFRARTSQVLK